MRVGLHNCSGWDGSVRARQIDRIAGVRALLVARKQLLGRLIDVD